MMCYVIDVLFRLATPDHGNCIVFIAVNNLKILPVTIIHILRLSRLLISFELDLLVSKVGTGTSLLELELNNNIFYRKRWILGWSTVLYVVFYIVCLVSVGVFIDFQSTEKGTNCALHVPTKPWHAVIQLHFPLLLYLTWFLRGRKFPADHWNITREYSAVSHSVLFFYILFVMEIILDTCGDEPNRVELRPGHCVQDVVADGMLVTFNICVSLCYPIWLCYFKYNGEQTVDSLPVPMHTREPVLTKLSQLYIRKFESFMQSHHASGYLALYRSLLKAMNAISDDNTEVFSTFMQIFDTFLTKEAPFPLALPLDFSREVQKWGNASHPSQTEIEDRLLQTKYVIQDIIYNFYLPQFEAEMKKDVSIISSECSFDTVSTFREEHPGKAPDFSLSFSPSIPSTSPSLSLPPSLSDPEAKLLS